MIKILLNGNEETLSKEMTLEELLVEKNLKIDKIAVEIDENVISKSSYHGITLKSGMKIEVITFVGGG